ncbi:MAG: hypothetical protein JWO72_500 [Caulobacteraceae bacterium]|nr:hypothetical protein [Caulobacteraceae bacterium]
MKTCLRFLGLGATSLLPLAAAAPADAGPPVVTVKSITASAPALGTVISGATGDTVFTISNAGLVSRSSGTGVRTTTGGVTAVTVTIHCGGAICAGGNGKIQSTGTPAGRAGSLTNFTPVSGTAILAAISGTNPVTFTFPASIPNNTDLTFTVGMDFPIDGNDNTSGTVAALSTSKFLVSVAEGSTTPGSTGTGTATATVYRALAMTKTGDMAFGTILKPPGVAGSVTLGNTGGAVTVSGAGYGKMSTGRPSTTPSSAQFKISGEAARVYTLNVPSTFVMAGTGTDSLTVSLSPTVASGPATFSGSAGAASTLTLGVGGSFSVGAATGYGIYTGTFAVTATYN